MNRWLLLKAMTLAELRTTLRERHQIIGMVVSIVILVIAMGVPMMQAVRGLKARAAAAPPSPAVVAPAGEAAAPGAAASDQPQPPPAGASQAQAGPPFHLSPRMLTTVRWITIGAGAAISLFFSLGYVISAALASFVGEKEAKTLEVLLSAPIPDTTLFLTKCLSVLLPSTAIGYLLIFIPASIGLVALRETLSMVPVNLPLHVLVLSVPPLFLMQLALVGLTAAVSAKAETVKGAGQVVGAVFMVPFFGLGYGLPLLLQWKPVREPVRALADQWLDVPFAVQYLAMLVLLAIPAVVLLALGRALFRRDRLLT